MSADKQPTDTAVALSGITRDSGVAIGSDSSTNKERMELLDISLKGRQIAKAELEIAQLKNFWPRLLEVVQKVAVPALVLCGAALAFVLGIPQAKRDLFEAQSKTYDAKQLADAAKQQAEAAKKLSDDSNKQVESSNRKVVELRDEQAVLEERNAALRREIAAADVATKEANQTIKVSPQGIDQVFVQFKGEIARETINGLRAALSAAGFKAPPAERIDRNQRNMVKYFSSSPDEKARATKVAAATREFFAKQLCPLGEIKVEKIELQGGKKAPIELWLDHACKITRP